MMVCTAAPIPANLASDYMRHRVRRSSREWEKIGASVQTL
jgi:hypothetical protein